MLRFVAELPIFQQIAQRYPDTLVVLLQTLILLPQGEIVWRQFAAEVGL